MSGNDCKWNRESANVQDVAEMAKTWQKDWLPFMHTGQSKSVLLDMKRKARFGASAIGNLLYVVPWARTSRFPKPVTVFCVLLTYSIAGCARVLQKETPMKRAGIFRVSRKASCSFLFLVIAALLVAACTAPVTIPRPADAPAAGTGDGGAESDALPPPELAGSYPIVDATNPMCSSLVVVKPAVTSRLLENLTFWTWHVNFQETPVGYDPPLDTQYYGCLRFFFREEPASGNDFSGGSKFLLTKCHVEGSGIASAPSGTLYDTEGNALSVWKADFDGASYLRCPVNLYDALQSYFGSQAYEDDLNAITGADPTRRADLDRAVRAEADDTNNNSLVVAYDYVSAIGVTGDHIIDGSEIGIAEDAAALTPPEYVPTHPIAYYQPDCRALSSEGECPFPFTHALSVAPGSAGEAFRIVTGIDGKQFSVPSAPTEPCRFADACEIWETFGEGSGVFTFSTFAYQNGSTKPWIDKCLRDFEPAYDGRALVQEWRYLSDDGIEWPQWCSEALAPDPRHELTDAIDFWFGDANIYIGFDPSVQPDPTFFKGSMYEVWVDPDRSGPQPTE